MVFVNKGATLSFVEGFKPKSLAKFKAQFGGGSSDEEMEVIFDKLNGNDRSTGKKVGKVKSKRSNKSGIQSGKGSARGDNKEK